MNPGQRISRHTYLRDPQSSKLGMRIMEDSIRLMDELGFEAFTFKKLGLQIGSPEASIYRYFENKHKLLTYLVSWYWGWVEECVIEAVGEQNDAQSKLEAAIRVLTYDVVRDERFSHIDEVSLNRVVVNESAKVYLTHNVDEENRRGMYALYKHLVDYLSRLVHDAAPNYRYPHTLMTTVIEGIHQQKFFAEHLPSLTDFTNPAPDVTAFFTDLVFAALGLRGQAS